MGKKAIITIRLVENSTETSNAEIEKEIFEELSSSFYLIPWSAEVEKVTVTEDKNAYE